MTEEILAQVHRDIVEAIERDEWCLTRWGKRWADCTEAERAEAHRLQATPLGGGFQARCCDTWQPGEPAVAHVVCDRVLNKNGKHTGKHMHHDPETGALRVAWWGKPRFPGISR